MIWFAPFQGLGDDDPVVHTPWPKAPPRPREDPSPREERAEREPEPPRRYAARASIKETLQPG